MGDLALRFRTTAHIAIVAGMCALALPARAENIFAYLDPSPGSPAAAPAATPWVTTTTPATHRAVPAEPPPERPAAARTNAPPAPRARGPIAPPSGPTQRPRELTGKRHALDGLASFYGEGERTANGERFDKRALTAAHKTLPFGTKVRVTRLDTGTSVVVRINDRGPFKPGRVIDLSEKAAENIGMTGVGLTSVRLEILGK